MAANMDTTGTFDIGPGLLTFILTYLIFYAYKWTQLKAKCFHEHSLFVCIHKHYSIDEWKLFAKNHPEGTDY